MLWQTKSQSGLPKYITKLSLYKKSDLKKKNMHLKYTYITDVADLWRRTSLYLFYFGCACLILKINNVFII